jgi:putative transposase
MTEKFQNKYRIGSRRLKNWDYANNAAYFVTICTGTRHDFFGFVNNAEMHLSEIGILANKYWNEIPQHFPFVELGEYVIMPNHVHGIVIINHTHDTLLKSGDSPPDGALSGDTLSVDTLHAGDPVDTLRSVDTLHATYLRESTLQPTSESTTTSKSPPPGTTHPPKNKKMQAISPKYGELSTVMRSYKSAVTKNARKIDPNFTWQSRFYDHIIRNDKSYVHIEKYIRENPSKWITDSNNQQKNKP